MPSERSQRSGAWAIVSWPSDQSCTAPAVIGRRSVRCAFDEPSMYTCKGARRTVWYPAQAGAEDRSTSCTIVHPGLVPGAAARRSLRFTPVDSVRCLVDPATSPGGRRGGPLDRDRHRHGRNVDLPWNMDAGCRLVVLSTCRHILRWCGIFRRWTTGYHDGFLMSGMDNPPSGLQETPWTSPANSSPMPLSAPCC